MPLRLKAASCLSDVVVTGMTFYRDVRIHLSIVRKNNSLVLQIQETNGKPILVAAQMLKSFLGGQLPKRWHLYNVRGKVKLDV